MTVTSRDPCICTCSLSYASVWIKIIFFKRQTNNFNFISSFLFYILFNMNKFETKAPSWVKNTNMDPLCGMQNISHWTHLVQVVKGTKWVFRVTYKIVRFNSHSLEGLTQGRCCTPTQVCPQNESAFETITHVHTTLGRCIWTNSSLIIEINICLLVLYKKKKIESSITIQRDIKGQTYTAVHKFMFYNFEFTFMISFVFCLTAIEQHKLLITL